MGPAEVAAWSLAGCIWEVFEYLPSGFEDAAEVRIGIHLGNGNPRKAKLAAYKSLLYSMLLMTAWTIAFIVFQNQTINFFTSNETLIDMLKKLVPLICIGNFVECTGEGADYVISAQSRPHLATWIEVVLEITIMFPLTFYFVFIRNYGLEAVLGSLIIGSSVYVVIISYGKKCNDVLNLDVL